MYVIPIQLYLNNYYIIQLTYIHIFITTWVCHFMNIVIHCTEKSIGCKRIRRGSMYTVQCTQLLYYFYTCGLQSRTGDVKLTNNVKEMGVEPSIDNFTTAHRKLLVYIHLIVFKYMFFF